MRNDSGYMPLNVEPLTDSNLSWTEKGVFMELSCWSDDNGISSITFEHFSTKVPKRDRKVFQFSEENFIKSFERLEEYGYIKFLGAIDKRIYVAYISGYEEQLKKLISE